MEMLEVAFLQLVGDHFPEGVLRGVVAKTFCFDCFCICHGSFAVGIPKPLRAEIWGSFAGILHRRKGQQLQGKMGKMG